MLKRFDKKTYRRINGLCDTGADCQKCKHNKKFTSDALMPYPKSTKRTINKMQKITTAAWNYFSSPNKRFNAEIKKNGKEENAKYVPCNQGRYKFTLFSPGHGGSDFSLLHTDTSNCIAWIKIHLDSPSLGELSYRSNRKIQERGPL